MIEIVDAEPLGSQIGVTVVDASRYACSSSDLKSEFASAVSTSASLSTYPKQVSSYASKLFRTSLSEYILGILSSSLAASSASSSSL